MWQSYNPNPCGRSVGDCAVRAIAKALDIDWESAYVLLASAAFSMCDMPSSNSVHSAILRQYGFNCVAIHGYTFGSFAEEHKEGTYVLGTGNHVACVKSGILYDAWDSSSELPIYVWIKRKDD